MSIPLELISASWAPSLDPFIREMEAGHCASGLRGMGSTLRAGRRLSKLLQTGAGNGGQKRGLQEWSLDYRTAKAQNEMKTQQSENKNL